MRRWIAILALAAAGAWCGYALLDARTRNGLTAEPWLWMVTVVGGAVVAPLPFLSGLPSRLARPNAAFWGTPNGLTVAAITVSLGVCAALAWDLVIVVIAG